MGINVPVIAGEEGGRAGDARLLEWGAGSDLWGAAVGVSLGSHHSSGEEGGQARRGVWCLGTFPELFYPPLCPGAKSCPCPSLGNGKEQPGWSIPSAASLNLSPAGHSSGLLGHPSPGRGLSRLETIQRAGAVRRREHRDPRLLPAGWGCPGSIRAPASPCLSLHLTEKPGPGGAQPVQPG